MSNLLQDPVFYGLLTNNSESKVTIANSSSGSKTSNIVGGAVNLPVIDTTKPTQTPTPSYDSRVGSLDFSFLQRLTFPTTTAPVSQTTMSFSRLPLSFDAQSVNSSYQPSVFSEALTAESVEESPAQDAASVKNHVNNIELLNSFKSIEELTGQNFLKDIPTTIKPITNDSNSPASDKKFHKFYSDISSTTSSGSSSPINKSLTYHKCPFCQRPFKNKSYLSRHLKKHDVVKDFKCPFFNETSSKCHHLNGEFSRKDTFKAHLKSIHFVYPIGVTKGDRGSSSGRCAGCFKEFENNSVWMSEHIEGGMCPAVQKTADVKDGE
ncbi:hypothetical protein WICPIJ_003575 [Wickerhamomyces pijperi]|uniref:C2H2-type domain-containing protein n=1 Tax=Wickerhamomyces pijperi TaxID=599730 RepID=A0A9P8TNR7_WICPI|nr:hypothetical protein WICPIJ_003575 [Wickerhamomyces pijperi]